MSVYNLFNTTSLSFSPPTDRLEKIFTTMMQQYNCAFEDVEIVLVDENEIVRINNEHLGKDYVTDIITFYYQEDHRGDTPVLDGTLYICLPRVIEQANERSIPTDQEFFRIVIHGLLHLLDFRDDTKTNKDRMTAEEDIILQIVNEPF